jgi:hypothetical protein
LEAENKRQLKDPKKAKEKTESQRALLWLGGAIVIGPLNVILYAANQLSHEGIQAFLTVMSTGLLLAGASVCVGGVFGFLFGIPRTLQQEGTGTNSPGRRTEYLPNTNLEQISDWLTKILVGIGLTQIPEISAGFSSLSRFAALGLGSGPSSQLFAFTLISYSMVLGFLFAYLWARLFLVGALRLADQAAIGALATEVQKMSEKAETTERQLEELKKQSALDADALSIAYRQLNPNPELPDPSQEELDKGLATASHPVKVQIFNQALELRGDNWREATSKPKMERTIPVFRALIRSDVENRYHRNHGQLGYALKDKVQPDWKEAEKEITTAIAIRGPWQEEGWLFYEFNRAVCIIMSDEEFVSGQPSNQDTRRRIVADLHAASQNDELRNISMADETIKSWMELNKIAQKDIRGISGARDSSNPPLE